MNDLVDRILSIYQLMRPLDPDRVSDSRQRITPIYRKPRLRRSKRCPAVGGVRFGLFERAARGARPSVYRLLGCASPWIMTASTPHCRAAEYPIGTLACPHRLKTISNGRCIKRGWPTPVSDHFGEINENGDSRTLLPDESSFES